MPYSLSFKSLARLKFRQFFRGKTKRDLIGLIVLLVYFWGVVILSFFLVKDELEAGQVFWPPCSCPWRFWTSCPS